MELRFCSAVADRHRDIVDQAGIDPTTVVGGGFVHVDGATLYLRGASGDFHAIPRAFQIRLAELLRRHVIECGVDVDQVSVNAEDRADELNAFWERVNLAA
jgi:hypothetical protein